MKDGPAYGAITDGQETPGHRHLFPQSAQASPPVKTGPCCGSPGLLLLAQIPPPNHLHRTSLKPTPRPPSPSLLAYRCQTKRRGHRLRHRPTDFGRPVVRDVTTTRGAKERALYDCQSNRGLRLGAISILDQITGGTVCVCVCVELHARRLVSSAFFAAFLCVVLQRLLRI